LEFVFPTSLGVYFISSKVTDTMFFLLGFKKYNYKLNNSYFSTVQDFVHPFMKELLYFGTLESF